MDEKRTILLVSTIIADLIVTIGWAVARLGKPESVRSARVMLCIVLGQFSLALLVAIGIVTAVAVDPPQIVLDLLP